MSGRGFLICMEGIDGSGKTTQAKLLAAKLRENYGAVFTAEPSDGAIGRLIKERILHSEHRSSSVIEALLFAADRIDHLESEVILALNEGKLVICDRYIHSSLAYQGATGLDLAWIKRINKHAIPPDLSIFIDVEPELTINRLKPIKSVMENVEMQRKVRDVYLGLVKNGELAKIDGNGSKMKVANDILKLVLAFLEKTC